MQHSICMFVSHQSMLAGLLLMDIYSKRLKYSEVQLYGHHWDQKGGLNRELRLITCSRPKEMKFDDQDQK